MKGQNIDIRIELDEENQLHHLKVLDKSTSEILKRGDPVPISISPVVEYETLVFTISADQSIWVSFDSIDKYVKKPEEAQIADI